MVVINVKVTYQVFYLPFLLLHNEERWKFIIIIIIMKQL